MADADDIADAITENAQGPKRAAGDTGSMEQHSLPDQIAAAKFAGAKAAMNSTGMGIRRVKLEPPGTA
jgi:hypothetical protein